MRCSDCSQEVNPIVCVDVDGTLGDYHGHFKQFAWLYLNRWPDPTNGPYNGSIPFSEWCMDAYGIDLATYRQIKLAYRQGGMKRTMPIFPAALDLCWDIKQAGAELWITTTRPYLSLDNIVPDTVEWCHRHGIEYAGMLFDENKYEEFSKRIDPERVCIVFDDLGEMYDAAERVFGHGVPWLVRGDFNSGVSRRAMCDLDTASMLATESIKTWRERHA